MPRLPNSPYCGKRVKRLAFIDSVDRVNRMTQAAVFLKTEAHLVQQDRRTCF